MTSFTLEQLRVVARIYSKYIGVKYHGIRIAENCPGDKGFKENSRNYAHTHPHQLGTMLGFWAGKKPTIVPKGIICIRRKVLVQSRRDQISLIVHELHHLRRGKGAWQHGSLIFQERASWWSHGTKWGFETSEGRTVRYLGYQVRKDIETATEINMVEEQTKLVNVRAFRDAYIAEHLSTE